MLVKVNGARQRAKEYSMGGGGRGRKLVREAPGQQRQGAKERGVESGEQVG